MNVVRSMQQAWRAETQLPIPTVPGAPPQRDSAPQRDSTPQRDAANAVLALRRATGALALALPLLVTVVDLFLPTVDWHVRGSLSAYYFAGTREIFTCGLAGTAALLIAFKAFDRRLEFWLTSAAGVLAILVAFFPTERCTRCGAATPLQEALGVKIVRDVHYASAATMIVLLAVVCVLWAALEQHTGIGSARFRLLHIVSAVVIAIALAFGAAMVISGPLFDQELLVVEWAAVWSFAVSWLSIGPAYEAREAARSARSGARSAAGAPADAQRRSTAPW